MVLGLTDSRKHLIAKPDHDERTPPPSSSGVPLYRRLREMRLSVQPLHDGPGRAFVGHNVSADSDGKDSPARIRFAGIATEIQGQLDFRPMIDTVVRCGQSKETVSNGNTSVEPDP